MRKVFRPPPGCRVPAKPQRPAAAVANAEIEVNERQATRVSAASPTPQLIRREFLRWGLLFAEDPLASDFWSYRRDPAKLREIIQACQKALAHLER